ncbi:MAG: bifunctional aldolase/short-chain dehydrogenase [Acidobacteriota bacterium]
MRPAWDDSAAKRWVEEYAAAGNDLAYRIYSSRLLGKQPDLVLHGGGNTSVKTTLPDVLGRPREVMYVKGSGRDLATARPEDFTAVDLERLRELEALETMDDETMIRLVRGAMLDYRHPYPSIETLVHAFLPPRYLDHTHADLVLALTNRENGGEVVREALGPDFLYLDYFEPGFELAKATAAAYRRQPEAVGAVWLRHGIVTWGESAREAYERMIRAVEAAAAYLEARRRPAVRVAVDVEGAERLWKQVAPLFRGALARTTGDEDRPWAPPVLQVLQDERTLQALARREARGWFVTPVVTTDHLIRTKPWPAWVEPPGDSSEEGWKRRVGEVVASYRERYAAYVDRGLPGAAGAVDPSPRVLLAPGLGAVCAGENLEEAVICRDVTAQTLAIKTWIGETGGSYQGLPEEQLCAMEFRGLQQAKVRRGGGLERYVALVTGAAGAIGAGICEGLLEAGCQVAACDISGERLQELAEYLQPRFGERLATVIMDVTSPESVADGFAAACARWGGVDFVIPNAGLAHVAALSELRPEDFQRLERVNVEGTLYVLAEAARLFERQGTGGDVVLVSTKNVFAPGARFGAYSATKAAAHQLARIASLELAPLGVRVNMVSPDAVFGDERFKSGLWAAVGPDRMRARGLDESQLQEYYRQRNLLKARVTARHVANAVLYFLTRQSPTTGATLPVDGGLPDATPR